ncbi:hypothetical protein F5Y16DRAFT_355059 [Xylariaceae sp. FL0255]|nr:hypothetical protein F5Y16DRAFT_355059 [Xylariaceae sp. FL0255]
MIQAGLVFLLHLPPHLSSPRKKSMFTAQDATTHLTYRALAVSTLHLTGTGHSSSIFNDCIDPTRECFCHFTHLYVLLGRARPLHDMDLLSIINLRSETPMVRTYHWC